jgi:ketosteroid isomerase-like protein
MAEHPNAEAVRRGYSAFANADMEAIQSLFADDVVWHVGGRSPLTGDYRGKEAVLGFLGDLVSQTGGTYGGEVHDVIASDTHAAALVRETGERQGKKLDQNSVHLYHVANGKVTEGWFYPGDPYADDEFWS